MIGGGNVKKQRTGFGDALVGSELSSLKTTFRSKRNTRYTDAEQQKRGDETKVKYNMGQKQGKKGKRKKGAKIPLNRTETGCIGRGSSGERYVFERREHREQVKSLGQNEKKIRGLGHKK